MIFPRCNVGVLEYRRIVNDIPNHLVLGVCKMVELRKTNAIIHHVEVTLVRWRKFSFELRKVLQLSASHADTQFICDKFTNISQGASRTPTLPQL